jgi:spore maturation protein CgeB
MERRQLALRVWKMKSSPIKIAFFGSSLVSAYWNGAATYYRGIIRALHEYGHRTVFYEPDAFERQAHRDIADPSWARIVVYSSHDENAALRALEEARAADLIVKASGIGAFDELLEREVLNARRPGNLVCFWDVDAPETLDRLRRNSRDPFRQLISKYDMILTYGGGEPVVQAYLEHGARLCVPIYNALDPTTHYRVASDPKYDAELAFLGNRLPDREQRVDNFFLNCAARLPDKRFVLAGNGWMDKPLSPNVSYLGHLYTKDHNAFNSTPKAILNINRDSMARFGYSPPTRIFEAAGASACIISDRWDGIEMFLEPEKEVLIAGDGLEVANHVNTLDRSKCRQIGAAAYRRIISQHTYAHRAAQIQALLAI